MSVASGRRPAALCAQLNIAHRLIAHGARVGLVHEATRLPRSIVTDLYHDVRGAPPPRGQMRHSCALLVANRKRQILTSIFAVRFVALAGTRPRAVYGHDWLAAYEEWLALTVARYHPLLGINDAWRVAEDLRIGAWSGPDAHAAAVMVDCPDCGRAYLVSAESRLSDDCPYCHLMSQSRTWRSGGRASSIVPATAEAPRARCALAAVR
jgi:hypothetical protein